MKVRGGARGVSGLRREPKKSSSGPPKVSYFLAKKRGKEVVVDAVCILKREGEKEEKRRSGLRGHSMDP